MGWPGLCSLMWARRSRGWGFFWVRYFFCFLLAIRSLCCRVLVISFWYLSVGSFWTFWKLFSLRKLWTFSCIRQCIWWRMFYPYQLWLPLHFSFKVCYLCILGYVCRLAVTLWWLSDALICFSFLVAMIPNGACILLSSIIIACSVFVIRSVQYFFRGFSILYCSQLLSNANSSCENLMFVRLAVLV